MAVAPYIGKRHGVPLSDSRTPLHVFSVEGRSVNGIPVAKRAFEDIRTGFNGASGLFSPGRLCGFMTDLPDVNGLAWRVHPGENVYGIAVTAGTFFRTVVSAYQVLCHPQLEPRVPIGGTLEGTSQWLSIPGYNLPASRERRDLGVRYASYGLYAVFLHELAHVLRGHLGYACQGDQHLCLDEQSSPATPDQKKLRLYVETDADELAGRMLAKLALKPYLNGELLNNERGRQTAFDLLIGVTLTFSGFRPVENCYHSGGLRTYVFMSALMEECGVERGRGARWVEERIPAIQELMSASNILDVDAIRYSAEEAQELLHGTLPAMRQLQHEWLACRPFKRAEVAKS